MAVVPSKTLAGKTALVTGACGTIGRAIARAMAAEGANIIIHFHTSAEQAASLCAELRDTGVESWAVQADFSDPGGVETLLAQATQRCETIDLLVNSASIFPESTMQGVTLAEFQNTMLVNAWAPFALSRAFSRLPTIGTGGQAIVNLIDSRIVGNDAAHTGYILSKHLLAAMTRMMAVEFAPEIRVNAVAPGLIAAGDTSIEDPSMEAAKNLPLKRPGLPHEAAEAVVYLLNSTSITGQVIYVDGGRHLREQASSLSCALN